MANLNLSEFGEKLFVTDADHTFIWDTVGAISKRVSRNSWLNSGTLTSDAPVTISQTWGNNLATFKALVVNAAGTSDANSASGSLLLDLQLNGVSQVSVKKSGQTTIGFLGSASVPSFIIGSNCGFYQPTNTVLAFSSNSSDVLRIYSLGLVLGSKYLGFGATVSTEDTILLRDGAANTLALRNGANAQTFNVYGTSSASNANYARLALTCGLDGNATISTQALGTGTAGVLALSPGGSERMRITTAGNVGIGTTAPNTVLHTYGGSGNLLKLQSSTNLGTAGQNISISFTQSGDFETGSIKNIYESTNNVAMTFSTFSTTLGERVRILGNGNVGIGTISPSSKLQVTGGDVEIETVTSGIIMKAAGTSTRYRITLNATGDALVFTAI